MKGSLLSCGGVVSCVLFVVFAFTGCLSERIEQRTITIQPDGSGVLRFVTQLSSSDANEVANRLEELAANDSSTNLTAIGFVNVTNEVLEDHSTQAAVRTTAEFSDWQTLAYWIYKDASNFDPARNVTVQKVDGLLVFDTFVPDESDSGKPADAELYELPFLTIAAGSGVVLESNADSTDQETAELHWSVGRVVTDGIQFRVQLRTAE